MDSVRKRANVSHGALVGGTAPAEQMADYRGATEEGGAVINDKGWNKQPTEIDVQLAEGVGNDWLWLLLRRFDKASSFVRYML
jgi:hypothetical protein